MRLYAETHPQSGVLLTWPHDGTDWRDDLEAADAAYLDITGALAARECALLICRDPPHREHVARLIAQAGIDGHSIRFATAPTNDTWVRDYGPLGIDSDDGPFLLDFTFDGWGNKYVSELDNRLSGILHAAGVFGETRLKSHPLVLEGGSIDVDGEGALLTTTRCLLDSGRNPGVDRHDLEHLFRELLGTDRVLWLEHGALEGDDTDGHVDMLARFCDTQTIVYTRSTDPAEPDYAGLAAMEAQLQTFRTRDGRPYRLIALPLPRPLYDADGRRLPASYANFLVINGAVLVPVYDDPADRTALERMARAFPDREIVAVNCLTLIRQNGSLHCATMQLPRGILDKSCNR
jgi:agmatine/peptidylarginine deiminase